jgi:hypothetical protein
MQGATSKLQHERSGAKGPMPEEGCENNDVGRVAWEEPHRSSAWAIAQKEQHEKQHGRNDITRGVTNARKMATCEK